MEDVGRKKGLDESEFLFCTDNMVSELIATAGLSRSETFYDLVVRLNCLCMRYRCQVRFIHISGTQMIGQGTDGLSRGSLYEGVVKVKPMLSFFPLR